jgi:integrase
VGEDSITLPGERTKNHREHVVPLSSPARDILKARYRVGDFVFGTQAGFSDWARAKNRLDVKIADWRLHDLRRSVATGMADIGILPHVIEAVLNHVSGHKAGVAGVYNRATYLTEKTAALTRWAEHLLSVTGEASHVVPLRAGAA